LIEVQTLGTPIVAIRVCGKPEVVVDGESGLLVDPRDSSQLVSAITKLLEDQGAHERFVQQGLRSAQRFRRDATFGQVLAALERAAAPVRR
jgi:glycosyltransferase involved in cell wall biosynthesis